MIAKVLILESIRGMPGRSPARLMGYLQLRSVVGRGLPSALAYSINDENTVRKKVDRWPTDGFECAVA